MTSPNDFDRRLGAWLDEGPAHAPDRTIDAALAHARAHPRRRDPLAVLRRDPMSGGGFAGALRPLPLVAVLGLILVAAIGVATVGGFFSRPSVVPPPCRRRPRRRHRHRPRPRPDRRSRPARRPSSGSISSTTSVAARSSRSPTSPARWSTPGPASRPRPAIHRRHRRREPAGRPDRGRPDLGRQPVRHPPRPDDRARTAGR